MRRSYHETIYTEGNGYFAALIEAINHAKHSITLETYIFCYDTIGTAVAEALVRAAQRQVKVRVLVDGAGSFVMWSGTIKLMLEEAGIETRVFHPFPWHLDIESHKTYQDLFQKAMLMLLNINARNHRKTCTIDKKIAFVGSMNVSDVHCHHHDHIGWRDTAIRLEGIDLGPLINAFNQAWDQQRFYQSIGDNFSRKPTPNPSIRLNHHWRQRRAMYRGLLRKLANAKSRIWITSAYFVPDQLVIRRLIKAAKRGIEVKILIPKKTDVRYMAWISTSFYPYLLKHGITIYEYQPTMLHAKTIIVDQWMIAGSSNLNHRSILHDLEVDINLQQAHAKRALIAQFEQDISQSKQVRPQDLSGTRKLTRMIGWALSYFKHWV